MINRFITPKASTLRMLATLTVVLFVPLLLWAQKRTVIGTVSSATTNELLHNITVRVLGTSRGTTTDDDGVYKITANAGETLVFSGIGYKTQEVKVGSSNTISVKLITSDEELENVVVTTALGIKREAKSLGFSQTTLDNRDLTDATSSNWTDALSGKVAGLNMIRSGAGPTGSNKIILRGENNLTGENEALIVVDGVVINNSSGRRTANGSEAVYGTGSDNMPADYGSGLSDINPEDIESVTVLKGPGAAALYGQRGANGAIIITTKSSKREKKGWGIVLNSGYSIEQVNRWPDFQFEYGQGLDGSNYYSFGATEDGASTSGTSSAYGPRFDGQKFYQYNPNLHGRDTVRTPWVSYPNKINNYFEQGKTFTNSVTMDGNLGVVKARLSYTNVQNEWIMPNTGYKRNTLSLTLNAKPLKKLSLSTKINYTNKNSDNLPGAGYGNQSVMYWYIFWQPNADLDWLKDYWAYTTKINPDGTREYTQQNGLKIFYPYSTFPENPYAIAYEFLNRSNRDGITGNVSATYNFTKNLSLMVRTAGDWGQEHRAQKRPYDAGSKLVKGSFRTQDITGQEWTSDFLLKYQKRFSKKFNLTVTGGGSTLRNNYDRTEMRADSLKGPAYYSLEGALGEPVYIPYASKYVINSFYALVAAEYKNYLFADISARQDWNSVLATPTRTTSSGFFYPSLNISYVLSDAMHLPQSISFAKLRFSLSSVGSGTAVPYRTSYSYARDFLFFQDSIYTNASVLTNPDLKPLRTVTAEVGGNVKFFNNRLGLDFAMYLGNTNNQILERIVDRSTGFTREVINAGRVKNTGLELTLNATPIKSKTGLVWNIDINYAGNNNRILSMPDTSLVLNTGPVAGGQIVAKIGGSMGDLYGRGYVRSPDGQIVYDAATGNALITQDVVYIGNTIPKGKIGLGNQFIYKGFRLGFRFDSQWGGVAHSLMHYKMVEQGKLKVTLPGRYNGIIGNGVVQNEDGTYRKNDVISKDIDDYYRSHMGADNAEGSTFKTDFIKFREARLDYTIPTRLIKGSGIERVSVGIYGRDLFIWSPWPMFDPEFGTLSGTDIVRGFEVAQFPSTRTIGANLVIGF